VPRGGARKRRLMGFVTGRVVNPLVRRALELGLPGTGAALLETTSRRSGQARRTPVGNGLRGQTFWIVTEHGRHAAYVKNIEADPRVRVKVGRRWMSGTAHILEDDDPAERMRLLRRGLNDRIVRLVGTEHLVIRVDLDP
jgi:deazaflavin-dependent oxidoreductase (nitroreductase family)